MDLFSCAFKPLAARHSPGSHSAALAGVCRSALAARRNPLAAARTPKVRAGSSAVAQVRTRGGPSSPAPAAQPVRHSARRPARGIRDDCPPDGRARAEPLSYRLITSPFVLLTATCSGPICSRPRGTQRATLPPSVSPSVSATRGSFRQSDHWVATFMAAPPLRTVCQLQTDQRDQFGSSNWG